jgi:hypothetical protein
MKQSHKKRDRNIFNDELKMGFNKKESREKDERNDRLTSEQIKNAHAAGMGALERNDENQIQNKDQVNSNEQNIAY